MTDWISVKDGLPENDDQVLVYAYHDLVLGNVNVITDKEREHRFGSFKNGRWDVWDYGDYDYNVPQTVSHWMPLPEPPKLEDIEL